ncbi:DUF6397 family protein [Streptomyces sp. NPDC053431]|uniref:DUF6397 family protein n=1 Tax=Streptomyces sp. NPDC053431 TaxID=3365703 RepID=UPI0037CD8DD5
MKREEFQLAVQLGFVRTVPGAMPGTAEGAADPTRRRVARSEIERLTKAPDFPEGLRERVRSVGTSEGAQLLSISKERFARLARTGHFSPVRFYVNRYRAVVWLYPAAELGEFALTHPGLLTGRLPLDVRIRADGGEDWRPRNWRARRLGMLLRASGDPWVRTAAIASLLDPVQLAEVVDDPFERAYLDRFRPAPPSWRPTTPAAREIADRLLLADDPDEILWHRMSLALALDEARADRQAPWPGAPPPGGHPLAPPGSILAALGVPMPATAPLGLPATAPATLPSPAPAVRPQTALPGGDAAGPVPGPAPTGPASSGPASSGPASSGPASSGPAPAGLAGGPMSPGEASLGPASPGPASLGTASAGPARPPGGIRPPGRRTRRSLLDRLRGRKEVRSRPGG